MFRLKKSSRSIPQVQPKTEVIEMAKEEIKEVKEPVKKLTPQELWDAAVTERKSKPQWSCENGHVPVYDYNFVVMLNEEVKAMDDNIFHLSEPLSVSVGLIHTHGNKVDPIVMIPDVNVTFMPPGVPPYVKATDIEGKIKFNPEFLGQWQFIVTDVGIAPRFMVIK